MATIKEIAEQASVSMATVSRILNQDTGLVVTDEVRTRVLNIAAQLQYIPPKMRHTHGNGQITIGVADWHIIRNDRPDIRLDSLGIMARQCMYNAESFDFVRIIPESERQVDGIIAFGNFSEEEMFFLRKQSKAFVFVNSELKDYEFDRIVMDYEQGIGDMVSYLLQQKKYRSIGYIGGIYRKNGIEIGIHRLQGLKEILQQRNCLNEAYIRIGELSREDGYKLTRELLETGDAPEVLILGNDEIADGALEALSQKECRIPKDVAVVIYEDIRTLESRYPTYTRLEMLPDSVWRAAIKQLLEQIMERRHDTMQIYLPTRLCIGDST